MFPKVLIANRGEIAVRIIRACRELGIQTVAVFSDADRQALHVRYADEAYRLGPAPACASYLRGDQIIKVALQCGAAAVHPGYGFLAERADFAEACRQAGLVFIGPDPSHIASMSDRAAARLAAARAGVPVVPGTEGEGALDDQALLALAPRLGFPLLVKATANGGKGICEVPSLAEMPALLQVARREAEAAYGDSSVYLEKLVEGAHQIEVQVLADAQGHVIHLGERECSIQRQHQRLLDESPSPFAAGDDDFRRRLWAAAVRVVEAVGYVSAGTVGFLVDAAKNFYFLEMNTRLQVEHPVTEMVTGVDLVKEQLRIASGCALSCQQEDIHQHGWALECRINAEDPFNNFNPSTGRITHSLLPTGPGIRVDTGVYTGFEVSPYYDSLISKLVVWGSTRSEAIHRLRRALEEYKILGVRSNIPFHQRLVDSPHFIRGQYDTRFIKEHFSLEAVDGRTCQPELVALLATLVAHQNTERATHVIHHNDRDTSNWKWLSRWERLQR